MEDNSTEKPPRNLPSSTCQAARTGKTNWEDSDKLSQALVPYEENRRKTPTAVLVEHRVPSYHSCQVCRRQRPCDMRGIEFSQGHAPETLQAGDGRAEATCSASTSDNRCHSAPTGLQETSTTNGLCTGTMQGLWKLQHPGRLCRPTNHLVKWKRMRPL